MQCAMDLLVNIVPEHSRIHHLQVPEFQEGFSTTPTRKNNSSLKRHKLLGSSVVLYSVCPENACAPGLFRDIGVHFGSIRLIIGGAVVFETLVCAGFFCITGISYLLDTPLASARTSHLMFFLG